MDIYAKSLDVLKRMAAAQAEKGFRICLLGGWAVWLYNPHMKSRDIDVAVGARDFWKLRDFLLSLGFRQTAKVLEKAGFALLWEGDKIEVDVYDRTVGPFAVSELVARSVKKRLDGQVVNVLSASDLFMLKAHTALERLGTAKGEKDLADVLALLAVASRRIDFKKVSQRVDLKELFALILKDFRTASRLYPMEMAKYKEMKAALRALGLVRA